MKKNLYILTTRKDSKLSYKIWSLFLQRINVLMVAINSSGNPVTYYLFMPVFRRSIHAVFCPCRKLKVFPGDAINGNRNFAMTTSTAWDQNVHVLYFLFHSHRSYSNETTSTLASLSKSKLSTFPDHSQNMRKCNTNALSNIIIHSVLDLEIEYVLETYSILAQKPMAMCR